MAVTICAVCSTGFSARSDAVYCSSACRQKAHRARTARRVAALSSQRPAAGRPVLVRSEVARTIQRAREHIEESRRLCRDTAERLQQMADLQREFGREMPATKPMPYAKWAR
ncbi:hypothetical protein [Mycolicibacterium goodii]|uniref:Uncharacterized protein n=1 Tax=Mycolicibacterium goodii TaxID=134601 RepID=A0ABS6HSP0_MYCGD|nr:hypothetical protein [Mycolicibacterium goodii]MBU8818529.1 hypothetical protein [Mycolicibacterium goodii]MBU8825709.1 hypothetical protein [Mycolicibacterium goodii]MBU8839940.1 hypothetical protein [Mycolicibacterium goodii]